MFPQRNSSVACCVIWPSIFVNDVSDVRGWGCLHQMLLAEFNSGFVMIPEQNFYGFFSKTNNQIMVHGTNYRVH